MESNAFSKSIKVLCKLYFIHWSATKLSGEY